MEKKFIILSLLVSVFFLLYMIADYNGIVRYFKLHFSSPEPFINSYKNLDSYDKNNKNKIVIAFSIPASPESRVLSLPKIPFINSILDQTVRVDDIGISIPYKDAKNIPSNIKKVLSVYGTSVNYKDSAICSALREPEANTKIILLEPDVVYGQDFIEKIIDASNKNPDKIIESKYARLIKPKFFNNKLSCQDAIDTCCSVDKVKMSYFENFKCL